MVEGDFFVIIFENSRNSKQCYLVGSECKRTQFLFLKPGNCWKSKFNMDSFASDGKFST